MKLLSSPRIAFRLLMMAAAAMVLIVAMRALNFQQLKVVYSAASDTQSVWMPRTVKLDQILFTMLRYHTTTIRKAIAVDPTEIKSLDGEFVEMDAAIPASLDGYKATITSDAERALWTAYQSKWNAYLEARAPIVQEAAKGNRAAAVAAIAPARPSLVDAFEAISAVINVNNAGASASALQAGQAYDTA